MAEGRVPGLNYSDLAHKEPLWPLLLGVALALAALCTFGVVMILAYQGIDC